MQHVVKLLWPLVHIATHTTTDSLNIEHVRKRLLTLNTCPVSTRIRNTAQLSETLRSSSTESAGVLHVHCGELRGVASENEYYDYPRLAQTARLDAMRS